MNKIVLDSWILILDILSGFFFWGFVLFASLFVFSCYHFMGAVTYILSAGGVTATVVTR